MCVVSRGAGQGVGRLDELGPTAPAPLSSPKVMVT